MPTETMGMEKEMLAGFCVHGNNPEECQACENIAYDKESTIVEKIGPATRVRDVIADKQASQETIKALIAVIKEKFADDTDLQNELTSNLESRIQESKEKGRTAAKKVA